MFKYTKQQLKAIETIDDNLQIIACAGSGKTQVISQRVVEILRKNTDIEPRNIIAFTYTEKAAAQLKTRILKLCRDDLGEIKGLAEMYIGTIHSWCLHTIQDNIYEYQKFSILDEIKLKLFIDKYYQNIGMASLGLDRYTDTSHFITILSVIREAKFIEGCSLPTEWLKALDLYENLLLAHSYFDFTMIITEAVRNLRENVDFKSKIKEQLKYLIIDEYQDVNPVQEDLISELSKTQCNICVVGDDDQTIYQWRGSDVNYIQTFRNRHDNVEYIKLEDNFRSSKGIIDSAIKCITNNTIRLPKVMKASGHQNFKVNDIIYNQYDNRYDENKFIVDSIKKLRGISFLDKTDSEPRGLDYSDFAILIRTWKKAHQIIEVLTEADIPFIVGGVNELFQRPEIKASQAIFQFLADIIEEDSLKDYWVEVSENIDSNKLDEAILFLKSKIPKSKTFYSTFSIQDIFWNFIEKADLREEIFEDPVHTGIVGNDINEIIFYNLGMFSQMINDFESIHFKDNPQYKLKLFLNFLTYSADGYYPEGWMNNSLRTPNAVQIMTIFQSKGLEFPVVFVPCLNRNYLPIMKPRGYIAKTSKFIQSLPIKNVERYLSKEEDERRLMYVAITRAQKYLFLSRSIENRLYQKESPFAKEVSNSDFVITDLNPSYSDLPVLDPIPKSGTSAIQLNFSVLKAFFDCPYKFKLISLYGFNSPITEQMGYGNSLHNILMELHRNCLEGKDISEVDINKLIERHVHIPYATEKVVQDIKRSAKIVTERYIDENRDDFKNIIYAEKDIQLDLGDWIIINGRMDLIKKKQLDGKELTYIVDFKSAKDAQKENMSMVQLSLYALGYKELSGQTADFLQIFNLDEKGHSKQTQPLDNNMLDSIKTEIIDSANAIRCNKLDKTNNKNSCKTCLHTKLCSGIIDK